jgi:hypothetical protein
VVHSAGRPDSDIDVLVDVRPDVRFGLIDLLSLKDFLEDQLGRRVEVVAFGRELKVAIVIGSPSSDTFVLWMRFSTHALIHVGV